jgi:hypothetical protein
MRWNVVFIPVPVRITGFLSKKILTKSALVNADASIFSIVHGNIFLQLGADDVNDANVPMSAMSAS